MAASGWRGAHVRDVVLTIGGLVGVALAMNGRGSRDWLVDDVATATTLSGLVCLGVAVAFWATPRPTGLLTRRRSLFVILAVLTAAAAAVGIVRAATSDVGFASGWGVLGTLVAAAIYLRLAFASVRTSTRGRTS